jgi:hypothetical protein
MARKKNSAASSARRKGRTAGSVRKHKKAMKGQGFSGSDIQYVRGKRKKSRKANPQYIVHDDAGKSIVKTKSKKAATYIARAASGHVTKGTKLVYSARRSNPKGKKNPATMLFANRAAALTYAASHGLKNFSISKVRKAK